MKFKISTSNVSGIKEYIIQKIRRKISYRELLALDHISFDIFKGEVVGIIGTNGSGKSTMLRIISGALKPSSGKVVVDRRKIQLLTLGAGFDTELSARENVYLNGAIIGYSKDFIDKNYDKIVEFAELDGFMEEKVKNFSSGMVSRLGFSIATAGDAAEILILDEVLSVGDEFFRKKSLKRVKEMIHGGSTVIMVSHGMATILDNCSKVVWIEKGKLRMIGEPKEVCDAYRKLEQSVQ
ncbi:MAG: ABC transporter ATP-binding protein [Lachnospiraceae bacterium]|nr:ABC transporter ATP-binding protein [Lachnospiraceae bacterium]